MIMNGISIIIPTYNREKYIEEAIQSVVNQDYAGNLEIIISDDGSSDKTLEIASSISNKVRILKKEKTCISQGASGARNRGINFATQAYIGFLDSDDFYLPNHLNSMVSVLENNPTLGFVYCLTLEVKDENGLRLYRKWIKHKIINNANTHPFLPGGISVCTNCFLIRREVFNEIGNFNETYSTGEDNDMWLRMFEKYKGAFVNHYGAVYRINSQENQLTKQIKDEHDKNNIAIYKNAIARTEKLELKDYYLIFELKRRLLNIKYKKKILMYFFNYLLLIVKYPLSFSKKIPYLISKFLRRKEINDWQELLFFLKYE